MSQIFTTQKMSVYSVSKVTIKGSGISLANCFSHLFYILSVTLQNQTRVKLNRVFFPRYQPQARSLGSRFAR